MREIQGYKSGHGQLEGWVQKLHKKLQFFKAIPIRSLVKYVCVCVVVPCREIDTYLGL